LRATTGSAGTTDGLDWSSQDRAATRGVLGGHALVHLYQNGFYVILPELYQVFGLNPITAGAVDTVRKVASGTASMVGGVVLDRYADKRIPVLWLSLVFMGIGYLLVGLAPTYLLLLVAAGLAGASGSIWHPAAIGLLSQAFPARRGFMISLHRSTGSVGDVVGPLLVGGLLVVVGAQAILVGAVPLVLAVTVVLWVLLARAPAWRAFREKADDPRSFRDQFSALGPVLRHPSLRILLVVKLLSGLGQGGLVLWLGLYLSEVVGLGSVGVSAHIALVTAVGIVAGPYIGSLSDRIGRRPVIVAVLGLKATFAALLALVAYGPWFTLLVALLGAVLFGANSLLQVAALDIGDGQRLEGSLVGLMWGVNAVSGGSAPLLMGVLVTALGFGVIFWFVALANAAAMLAALALRLVRPTADVAN